MTNEILHLKYFNVMHTFGINGMRQIFKMEAPVK